MAIATTGISRPSISIRTIGALLIFIVGLARLATAEKPQLSADELYDIGQYGYLIDSLSAGSDAESLIRARACVAAGDKDKALQTLSHIQTASLEAAAIFYGYGDYRQAESLAMICRTDSGITAEIADYIMAASAPDSAVFRLAIWHRLLGSSISIFKAKAALEIAKMQITEGKFDSALVVLQLVDPYVLNGRDLVDYRFAQAEIYYDLGNFGQAIDQIDVLIGTHSLSSDKEKAVSFAIDSLYPRLDSQQSYRLGQIFQRGHFYEPAIRIFESPGGPDTTGLNLAWCYFGDRRYRQASDIFRKLAELADEQVRAESYYGKAVCEYRQGRRLDAVNDLLKFVADFPDHRLASRALFTAGEFYAGSDSQRSIDIFRRLVAAYPDSPYRKRTLFLLAKAYVESGLVDKADAIFASYDQEDETADLFDFWRYKIAPNDSGGLQRIINRKYPTFYHYRARTILSATATDTAIDYDSFIDDFLDRAENFLKWKYKLKTSAKPLPTTIDTLVYYGLPEQAGRELSYLESISGDPAVTLAILRKCRSLELDWVFFNLLESFKMRLKQLGYSFSQDTWLRLSYPVLFKDRLAYYKDKVDPYLALGILRRESRFNPAAVSNVGAIGLMQLMPPTAAQMAGLDDLPDDLLFDPGYNIRLGCKYLRWLTVRLKKKEVVVAAYNAGPTAAKRWQRLAGSDVETYIESIGYDQSRNYARWVIGDYLWYKYLWPGEFSN